MESVKSKLPSRTDLHIARKLWHMGVGVIILRSYYELGWSAQSWARISLSLATGGFLFDWIRLRNPAVFSFALRVLSPFYRESEKKQISGFPYYALGAAISLFFFPEKIAVLSVFFLVFSDPISSFVGITLGKTKLINGKSLEGSLAGWLVCSCLCIFYLTKFRPGAEYWAIFSLLAGLVGSLSELVSNKIDDNLTIPVLSGLGMTALNYLFPVF